VKNVKPDRKYDYLSIVQTYTCYGWEDVASYLTRREGANGLREYRANQSCAQHRLIERRVLR